ncbi:MAG TPA: DUF4328 domain-containing protein [Candidatus Limnocylindrales bacterium]|nr:DUF4328 domain-containing protein [Candidatus Limnocylindrales bacterium]
MSTLAGDFWVCGDCRSINNAGARQCYNCRTPRDRAAVDPETIDPTSHGPLRAIELPPFKASRWAAALASILILAVGVMQIVQFSLLRQYLDYLAAGGATDEQRAYIATITIVALGIALLALIAWALWLSRTVTSMPALGLGYPAANGMMAFVENFIPILNLWRVPAIVRDVARRLEPKVGGDEVMTRGEALVFAAWISVFGGYIVPRVLSLFTSNLDTLVTITGIGLGLGVVGAIFLVVLIWWVEGKVAERRRLQLAGMAAPSDPSAAATVHESTREAMPNAVLAASSLDAARDRSAFSAFAAGGSSGAEGFRLPATEDPPLVAAAAVGTRPTPGAESRAETAPDVTPEARLAEGPVLAQEPVAAPEPEPAPAPEPIAAGASAPPVERVTAPEALLAAATALQPNEAPTPPTEEPPTPVAPPAALAEKPTAAAPAEEPAAPAPTVGPPDLKIRISSRGLMTAELDGEVEHIMLDDLGPYAEALSHVAGTATIYLPNDEGMPALIGKRAQRILEDAGVRVTLA